MSVKPVASINADFVRQHLAVLKKQRKLSAKKADAPNRARKAYRRAASLLAHFSLDDLKAYPSVKARPISVPGFLSDALVLEGESIDNLWELKRDVRRVELRKLGSREKMRKVRAANNITDPSPLQNMIDLLISDEMPDPVSLERRELVSLAVARRWFEGVLDELPDAGLIKRCLAMADLLAPLEKLAGPKGSHFVGRVDELQALRDYVGVLPAGSTIGAAWRFVTETWYQLSDRPPLFIHGPGGIGKSTLIAKFILEHTSRGDGSPALPAIYLNFDRPGLNPKLPVTFLLEAAMQLGSQFLELTEEAGRFRSMLRENLDTVDAVESTKSNFSTSNYISQFARLCNQLPNKDAPILFVFDTFEEIQFLGLPFVENIWQFMADIQRTQPRMRFVISGRVKIPKHLEANQISLPNLDQSSAILFLKRKFAELDAEPLEKGVVEGIVDAIGYNPLSLMLTAWLVSQEGIKVLKSIETRKFFLIRLRAERIQAVLYDRILSHIHKRNTKYGKELQKLAHPGLIVRRITTEIIEKVLAGPCELDLSDPNMAEELFDQLAKEVALVENDPEDHEGALRHHTEVRRMMLDELVASQGEKTRKIDEAAVAYYKNFDHPIMRAEEIYHRLRLGQDAEEIDPRWMSGIDDKLRGALEEVGPVERLYLSTKLGVTPDEKLLTQASQEVWEIAAARSVQTYLADGDFSRAYEEMRKNSNRSPGSQLFYLEAEALRALDRPMEAIAVAQLGLQSVAQTSAKGPADAARLELLISLVEESLGNFEMAVESAERAISLSEKANDEMGLLQARLALARLFRKKGLERSDVLDELTKQAPESFDRKAIAELRRRPAIARELAAETAEFSNDNLELALETIGVEVTDEQQKEILAATLEQWNNEELGRRKGELAESLGLGRGAVSVETWRDWIEKNIGTSLNRQLLNLLLRFSPGEGTRKMMGKLFQRSVDAAIEQTIRKRT